MNALALVDFRGNRKGKLVTIDREWLARLIGAGSQPQSQRTSAGLGMGGPGEHLDLGEETPG